MQPLSSSIIATPLGLLRIEASGQGVRLVTFVDETVESLDQSTPDANEILAAATEQLSEYFAGSRREFSVPLDPAGTEFQRAVWRALAGIPHGRTSTYGEIARIIEQPTAYQAVGLANGRNPIAIIVPCHRVVGTNGKLTGYAGGIERKRWLLGHEGATLF